MGIFDTPALAVSRPDLFGTREVRNDNLKPFPKWTGVMERYFEDKAKATGPCDAKSFNRCHYEKWDELVTSLAGQDRSTQIHEVNRFMNGAKYIVDPINWGVKDYWATPNQFFQKYGDCEDYAIAKYLTLKRLGVPADSMRILVLQDLNLGIPHAVLVVYENGRALILDNQIKQVVDATTIRHYRPIFSINESAWWLHKAKRKARAKTRYRRRASSSPVAASAGSSNRTAGEQDRLGVEKASP